MQSNVKNWLLQKFSNLEDQTKIILKSTVLDDLKKAEMVAGLLQELISHNATMQENVEQNQCNQTEIVCLLQKSSNLEDQTKTVLKRSEKGWNGGRIASGADQS